MPSIVLTAKYKIADKLVFSASSFLDEFLHGIPLTDTNGNSYPIVQLKKKIKEQTKKLENFLNIKIYEQEISEHQDYIHEEWKNWGHIKLQNRVNEITTLEGWISDTKVMTMPTNIIVFKGKTISLVPGSSALATAIWFNNAGVYPVLQSGVSMVPDFWHITYKSGFKEIPEDILEVLGKLVSIQVLAVLGDILLGAGIASESLSFDGLSQSISTTQSAENSAYSARIKQYQTELKTDLRNLFNYYRGISFETV